MLFCASFTLRVSVEFCSSFLRVELLSLTHLSFDTAKIRTSLPSIPCYSVPFRPNILTPSHLHTLTPSHLHTLTPSRLPQIFQYQLLLVREEGFSVLRTLADQPFQFVAVVDGVFQAVGGSLLAFRVGVVLQCEFPFIYHNLSGDEERLLMRGNVSRGWWWARESSTRLSFRAFRLCLR